jgi:hypothetical protein
MLLGVSATRAEISAEDDTCGNVKTDIATDRPDVTNSSQVAHGRFGLRFSTAFEVKVAAPL